MSSMPPMSEPVVSIIIRSRNEESYIGRCLEALFAQKGEIPFEIIVLDSESSDRTVEIANGYDVSIYSIPAKLFTYSSSLNFCCELAKGKYLALLSAHAIPVDDNWMMFHVEHLESDSELVGSFSRQIPWPKAASSQKLGMHTVFSDTSFTIDSNVVKKLISDGMEPFHALFFSNASCFIRKTFHVEHPFREMPFSEDRAFALDAVSAGKKVAYLPTSTVYHSHSPSFREFYVESIRATLSRGMVNNLYASRFNVPEQEGVRESLAVLYAKLPILAVITFLKLAYHLPSILSANQASLAEVKFYLASFGTTLGKIRGVWEFSRVSDYDCPPANIDKLKSNATQLR